MSWAKNRKVGVNPPFLEPHMGLRLLSLGTGDAFSAQRYSSCFALEAHGQWLLVDCPHPLRKIWREATQAAGLPPDMDHIAGCALTHLHGDHCSGLEIFAFYCRFIQKRRLPLLCHGDVARDLWPKHLAASMEKSLQQAGQPPVEHTFDEYFEHHPLYEDATTTLGPFTIRCRRTLHHIPTFAMLIQAGGQTLGYSTDTAFDPSLIEWLCQADRVVHEASSGFLHTAYADLAALSEPVRRKTWLIHYPDSFDAKSSVIEPLREGRLYDVQAV